MSGDTVKARILVASDNASDADQVVEELSSEFESIQISTKSERWADDFGAYAPHVVVLAFDGLEKAERYCADLHPPGDARPHLGHRTVILCHRAELRSVVDRCKKDQFDDYVLYRPYSDDGPRLVMSIRNACREVAFIRKHAAPSLCLLGRAKYVDELDRIMDAEQSGTELGNEAFGSRMDVRDKQVLTKEIDHLKNQRDDLARRAVAIGIDSIRTGSRGLMDKLETSRARTRALAQEARKIRPLVMVVEDDEFARHLISRALDPRFWDAVYVVDGSEAVSRLTLIRPDIILMDVSLPGIDGVSLTKHLKSSPYLADIPVIIMTGDARRETVASSVAAGAAAFVVKPFSRKVLAAKMERALAPWKEANARLDLD